MRCPQCSFDSQDGTRFCTECGASLAPRCPNCGAENRWEARYCGQCAVQLSAVSGQSAVAGIPVALDLRLAAAERRQLTVMFCDLVASTAMSIALDPEELRDVLRAYQGACAEVVARFEGHIARYLGDGLLVYFGYPVAHEDDAHRAVHAGLGIVEAIARLNARLRDEWGVTLAVRLGISTGLTVVGELGTGEHPEAVDIVGEGPIVAFRLQEVAEPNTVLVSPSTYRLIEGFFECQDVGDVTLKGIVQPVRPSRVVRATGALSRFEVAARAGMTPLVGRDHELELLIDRWQRARAGITEIVFIQGEPGIGKSRQMRVLSGQLENEPHFLIELRCSAHHAQSAYFPVVEHLHRVLRLDHEHSTEGKISRLERALARFGMVQSDAVALLASLLSIPLDGRYQPLDVTPQRQRQGTLELLLNWLAAMAASRPVLMIVEDLHWADPSTLEFLSVLFGREPSVPLLCVLTFRPEFRPTWQPRANVTAIEMSRLSRDQTIAMIGQVAGNAQLPPDLVEEIVARTDGVPLFVEELTKAVIESDLVHETTTGYELTRPLERLAIPTTLQDSLMARLDRLSTAKPVAQLGAMLGRDFHYAVLRAVSSLDEETLRRELDRLTAAELLDRAVAPPGMYSFRHALIQDAAYQSLLRRTRQQYHARIAYVFEERFPDTVDNQPELLAHHYTAAGMHRTAVTYWQRAGQRAFQRSAIEESIAHLRRGLDLVKMLPESPETREQELLLLTTLGPAVIIRNGFGAPEIGETYRRARQLCQELGQIPQVFPSLWGLWVFHLVRGELRLARELAESMLQLGEQSGDAGLLVEAHWTLGDALFWLGELESARDHLERAVALYESDHRAHAFTFGQDPGVAARCYLALVLWFLGQYDRALETSEEALRLAREQSHPFTLGWALGCGALLREWTGDPTATRDMAEAVVRFCTEQAHAFWLAAGSILRGWALTRLGQSAEGIEQMRGGLEAYRATGSGVVQPHFLGLLAEAIAEAGDVVEALALLDEAFALADRNEERVSEIGLLRLRGKLLLVGPSSDVESAESYLRQSLDVARATHARFPELLAALDLATLWRSQGRVDNAHQLVTLVYAHVDPGCETLPARQARALLAALGEELQLSS